MADINAFAEHPAFRLVAVADVDLCRIVPLQQRFPDVRVYQDWRELLAREDRNIDSVNVSIPDHMHYAVAMKALDAGKAVYVEKPLCNTLVETRRLTERARRRGLTTQMGIQVSSSRDQLYGEALVRRGVVGKIREVHTFSNKSWGDDVPLARSGNPVPAPLDWDGWLGVSATRPFINGEYHPGEWRRRVGFGTGTLGDMGCHIYSPPYRALKLTSPVAVTSYGPPPTDESWGTKARVKLTYPGTEFTAGPAVDVWWYDGGELPPPAIVETLGARLPPQGSVLVGTDGLLVLPHIRPGPFAISGGRDIALPAIETAERDHYREFIDAVLRRRADTLLDQLRLRGTADRVGAHRQCGGAFPGREAGVRRAIPVIPEAPGGERLPDAIVPARLVDVTSFFGRRARREGVLRQRLTRCRRKNARATSKTPARSSDRRSAEPRVRSRTVIRNGPASSSRSLRLKNVCGSPSTRRSVTSLPAAASASYSSTLCPCGTEPSASPCMIRNGGAPDRT